MFELRMTFVALYNKKRAAVSGGSDREKDDDAETPPDAQEALKMALIGTRCVCLLLDRASHFNYAANVVAIVVPLLSSPYEKVQSLR